MKNTYLILALAFLACKKQNSSINYGYNSYYHIENNDTLSWIHVPNSFTPDGDGVNDQFKPSCSGISQVNYEMVIYDATNTSIFKITDLYIAWDGTHKDKKAASGWYTFKLEATDTTGYNYTISNDLYLMQ